MAPPRKATTAVAPAAGDGRTKRTTSAASSRNSTKTSSSKATTTSRVVKSKAQVAAVDEVTTTTSSPQNKVTTTPHDDDSPLHQLVPHWQTYQKKRSEEITDHDVTVTNTFLLDKASSSTSMLLTRSMAGIISTTNDYAVSKRMQDLSLNDSKAKDDDDDDETTTNKNAMWNDLVVDEFTNALVHFVDCAIATLAAGASSSTGSSTISATPKRRTGAASSSASSSSLEQLTAAMALLELTMAVAIAMTTTTKTSSSFAPLLHLVDHVTRFSAACTVEVVRVVATTCLGYVARRISNPNSANNNDTTLPLLLDKLQQAILPRLTDTAVSVRGAAVQCVFGIASEHDDDDNNVNMLGTDPDLHQAVVWVLQHDSSPTNRALAAMILPVSLSTLDVVICRLRDTKVTVRVAAIQALSRGATIVETSNHHDKLTCLQSHHMAEIVAAGLTDRCPATKLATRQLICATWLKAVQFDPIRLLECIDAVNHPKAASAVIGILYETAADLSLLNCNDSDDDILSHNEGLAFSNGMSAASQFSIEELLLPTALQDNDEDDVATDSEATRRLPIEQLFFARNILDLTASARDKDKLLSQLVPDIIVLCQVLERYATQLVHTLAAADDSAVDDEEKLLFLCSELLHLATANSGSTTNTMEEGSRRVFTSAMKSMLTNLLTPDDLIEGCCKALQQASSDHGRSSGGATGETDILWVLRELQANVTDELSDNTTLRIISILGTVLETMGRGTSGTSSMSAEAMEMYVDCVVPVVTDSSKLDLVREAAVTCLGQLGIVSNATTVQETYQPLLIAIATDDSERMELRIQATMALIDWSMVHQRGSSSSPSLDSSIEQLIGSWMEPQENAIGTVCIAAEMATKLLLVQAHHIQTPTAETAVPPVRVHSWLARLLVLFFETEHAGEDSDDDDMDDVLADETRIGSPIRLQQILSLFFPAFTASTSAWGRNALLESIAPLLNMITTRETRKGRRSKAPPIAKMVDYVVSTVDQSRQLVLELAATENSANDGGTKVAESSPSLLASIHVATFLSEKSPDLTTTMRRTLCKIIGATAIADLDQELWEHLSLLKELIEELVGNVVDEDALCVKSLTAVADLLEDVEVEDDIVSDEDETEDESSLAEALVQLDIANGDNNVENEHAADGASDKAATKLSRSRARSSVSDENTKRLSNVFGLSP